MPDKKHKLEIPKEMMKWVTPGLKQRQGEVFSKSDVEKEPWLLKNGFLTEIKEPLTKHEAWDVCGGSYKENHLRSPDCWFYSGWDFCLENQKLGVVADEEWDTDRFNIACKEYKKIVGLPLSIHSNEVAAIFWKAALKYARGE